MRKLLPFLLCLGLMTSCCSSPAPAEEGALHILATTYPVYLFVTAVTEGAEGVEVDRLITEEVSCLHDYTLTVTDMKAIEKADIIIINGAELEEFMEDALARSDAAVIDCSEGIALLENEGHEEHEHEHIDHDHGHYDPHIWMDPANAATMVDNIASELSVLDGTHHELYTEHAAAAKALLSDVSLEFQAPALPYLVTFHDGFQYFADAFGLELLKAIEEEEGSEASAAEIREISALVEEYGLPAIFTEKNGSSATANAIARETGCKVYPLDMLMSGKGSGIQPYLDTMYANLDTISLALGGE